MNRIEYQQYLQSNHWLQLRAKKLKQSKKRCGICLSPHRLEIHHLTYRNIYDVETADLRVLCHDCHDLYHKLKDEGRIKPVAGGDQKQFANVRHYVKLSLGMIRPRRNE